MTGVHLSDVVLLGVDLALLILAAEALILSVYRWRTGGGLSYVNIALICTAGLGLLLALKAALLNVNPLWLALALAIGGTAHGFDLVRRMRHETTISGRAAKNSGA